MAHPNIQLLERAADSLGELLDQFVFVGGSTTVLMVSDPAAPPSRASIDIDAIVRLESRADYYRLGKELRARGFVEDQSGDAPLCRWRLDDLVLDVMPTEETVLGFSNRWYEHTIVTAQHHRLPSGRRIRLATPPCFLATKLEAFHSRGQRDYLASEDMEDIIAVLDGRPEIVDEVAGVDSTLRGYLIEQLTRLLASADFRQALPGHLEMSGATAGRSGQVLRRIQSIVDSEE